MTLDVVTATLGQPRAEECITSWGCPAPLRIAGEAGMLAAYQAGYESSEAEVIAFLHDDLLLKEDDWRVRALREFDDPTIGVVGFGGALVHGSLDLYKTPYQLTQLGRSFYLSNVDDAEVHGARFAGSCDVATLDGFALVVRRRLLDLASGWPLGTPIGYSLYDYWLTCMAHRLGYRVRLVGVRCQHLGGLTAVGLGLAEGSGEAHAAAHRWLYDNFSDCLPFDAQNEVKRELGI